MKVEIDNNSGFCFGVRRAIATLENGLERGLQLYCVGDIVHNEQEIERLTRQGLKVINSEQLSDLHNADVLFRAHGEPPSSYQIVQHNGLRLTDATCPVVLRLQQHIREAYTRMKQCGGHVVIFGKKGHAEVIGLVGQTDGDCILVENEEQALQVHTSAPLEIFAQTTKNPQLYARIIDIIRGQNTSTITAHDTICRQMAARADHLPRFAARHELIIFVGGAKSSNSKVLFDICHNINPNSHFVSSETEVLPQWTLAHNIGITGATSTPLWLMQKVKEKLLTLQLANT